jgi:hypothetical protein
MLLLIAIALGGAVAVCCLLAVFGVGVEPDAGLTVSGLAFASVALLPAAILAYRWHILRTPARLVVGSETVTIAYPELLRQPVVVPRDVMRIATVDADGTIASASTPRPGRTGAARTTATCGAGARRRSRFCRVLALLGLGVFAVRLVLWLG